MSATTRQRTLPMELLPVVQGHADHAPLPPLDHRSIAVAWRLLAAARAGYYLLLETVERVAPMALRVSLALVFVWFGALKVAGDSPIAALVAATVPWLAPALLMQMLGGVEVLLGVGLLLGRAQRLLLLLLAAHLSGTFLSFVMAPQLMFQHGRPMLLTADGEFVLKNLVLISAALLLAASSILPSHRPRTRS